MNTKPRLVYYRSSTCRFCSAFDTLWEKQLKPYVQLQGIQIYTETISVPLVSSHIWQQAKANLGLRSVPALVLSVPSENDTVKNHVFPGKSAEDRTFSSIALWMESSIHPWIVTNLSSTLQNTLNMVWMFSRREDMDTIRWAEQLSHIFAHDLIQVRLFIIPITHVMPTPSIMYTDSKGKLHSFSGLSKDDFSEWVYRLTYDT
jgi:hypothetical protein